jgi:hypothetical protein
MPGGWFEQNKLTMARMHMNLYWPAVNATTRTASPAAVTRMTDACEKIGLNPFGLFARILLPALNRSPQKFVRAQSVADLARVACVLERYRLAHGEYPASLDALAPQFIAKLPHDLINGQPLKYRRTDNGQFILYSVGWNETDDGGEIVLTKSGAHVDIAQGDWVWRYPVK